MKLKRTVRGFSFIIAWQLIDPFYQTGFVVCLSVCFGKLNFFATIFVLFGPQNSCLCGSIDLFLSLFFFGGGGGKVYFYI